MNATVCGFVSTLVEKLSWLYQQREWSRQELLLIALGVLLLIYWGLRRRRKKTALPVHPEHLADLSSVIGSHLSERRHGRRHFGESRKGLSANVSSKHAKSPRAGSVSRQDQTPDGRAGRSQWEVAKPKTFGAGFKAKVPARVGADEWHLHEANEKADQVAPADKTAAETSIAEQPRHEAAQNVPPAGGLEQSAAPEQAQSTLVQRIDELNAVNERLVHEADEHRQVQDHFEARLAELTAVNEQLQRQIGELRTGGPKKRVYTYEDEHRVVDNVRQKLCRKCGEWKDESEFHKNASRKDGLARWCKVCKVGASRKSRARRASPNQ